ncbi:MAG: hypothetical protein LBI18_06865, partial [Planctomycetaceae bacterium]|nr:hypothetical protein [Planctomycetaceae bacterium]
MGDVSPKGFHPPSHYRKAILTLCSFGNLYCQTVWNLIASQTKGLVGYRRRDLSAKGRPPKRQVMLPRRWVMFRRRAFTHHHV